MARITEPAYHRYRGSKIRLHLKLACESACVARTNACRSRTPVAIQPIIFAKFVVSLMRLMVNTGVNGCDVVWAVGSFDQEQLDARNNCLFKPPFVSSGNTHHASGLAVQHD